jgi:hypothetical protein
MPRTCPVCGKPADIWAIADGGPCMKCVRLRARAAMDHRCHCRTDRFGKLMSHLNRTWLSCTRCLGTIRTVS